MNAIHQISLKLRLGIDPAAPVRPSTLRAMWEARVRRDSGDVVRAAPRDAVGRAIRPRPPRS